MNRGTVGGGVDPPTPLPSIRTLGPTILSHGKGTSTSTSTDTKPDNI